MRLPIYSIALSIPVLAPVTRGLQRLLIRRLSYHTRPEYIPNGRLRANAYDILSPFFQSWALQLILIFTSTLFSVAA